MKSKEEIEQLAFKILPHISDAFSFVSKSTITSYYSIALSSKAYDKLLAIQTKPDTKYWFKDKEVSIEELINILETAKFKQLNK